MLLFGVAMSPLVAHAETTSKTARIGLLQVARASPSTAPAYQAFFNELNRYGFRAGENLVAEMRWADEDARGPQEAAAELARLPVDVLVVEGAEANLQKTSGVLIAVPRKAPSESRSLSRLTMLSARLSTAHAKAMSSRGSRTIPHRRRVVRIMSAAISSKLRQ
jgi:ribosomal protein L32